jgi:hypothetical protein
MYHVKWKLTALAIVTLMALVVLAVYPFETTIIEEWKLRVIDEQGKPATGVPISEYWDNDRIGVPQQSEMLVSDSAGYIIFPKRMVRISLSKRLFGITTNALRFHGHSEGPGAYLIVQGPYHATTTGPYYVPGRPLSSEIVIRVSSGPDR